jgi:hypothetical protein
LSPVEQEKLMHKFKIGKISLAAFVLVALAAGCGREQAPSPAFPSLIVTSPAKGATAVLLNTAVTAGFSSVMAPATINTTTFTFLNLAEELQECLLRQILGFRRISQHAQAKGVHSPGMQLIDRFKGCGVALLR